MFLRDDLIVPMTWLHQFQDAAICRCTAGWSGGRRTWGSQTVGQTAGLDHIILFQFFFYMQYNTITIYHKNWSELILVVLKKLATNLGQSLCLTASSFHFGRHIKRL